MATGVKAKSVVVVAPFTPFGSDYASFPEVVIDDATCSITVSPTPLWFVDLLEQPLNYRVGAPGGWLPHKRKRKEVTEARYAKIKAKRERREEYVMRKIYNELKGIDFADDPELVALMAEFETPEEVYRSAEEIKQALNDAYMKYVIGRELRIAEQDKEDEDEIMALLSLTL